LFNWASAIISIFCKLLIEFLDEFIFLFQFKGKICDFFIRVEFFHFKNHAFLDMLTQFIVRISDFLFEIFYFEFQNVNLNIFLIEFVVYFHCFLSENGQFLFKILYSIIGWKHFLLFFRFVLDFGEFFLNFFDVISVSKQKLCLMFFYHMFHFRIHVIYCGVDLIVEFMNLLDRFFIVKVSRIVLWGVLLAGILCSDHEWRVLILFGWFRMKDRRRGLVGV
jgi:hypothetical protein